jgi:menaquinone-dependent protoporphyrinogen oxidase
MTSTVLVAYATKHGSTREVAEAVAKRLQAYGMATFVRSAGDVTGLEGYDAVVLGSAIYLGRLHVDARNFLRRHRREIGVRPLAVFAIGPRTLDDDELRSSQGQLDAALAKGPGLKPTTAAVFGGVFDPAQHRFPFNRMPASDARDWAAIRAWSDEVANQFTQVKAA